MKEDTNFKDAKGQKTWSRRQFISGLTIAASAAGLAACGGTSTSTDAGSAAGSAAAAGDASYTTVEEGKLIAASDLAYPPLESVEGDEEPKGFEVDVVKALAEKLGLTAEYLPAQKFDTIIPMIKQGGKADIGASSFTITDDRKKEIDFTDPFMDSNQAVVTKADSDATTEEALNVEGKQIAVQSGTTGEEWVNENLTKATCVPLDDAIQAMTGLSSGLYDAVVADLPVMAYLCKESYTDLKVAIEVPTGEQYGIVVSKDNPGLTAALNDALAEIQDDGTMKELEEKWFGEEL